MPEEYHTHTLCHHEEVTKPVYQLPLPWLTPLALRSLFQ